MGNSLEKQTGMTKRQSAMLQGMAILLMIYHHFFSDITIYEKHLQFMRPEWVIRAAWFGKICVGIFAFVSGYGMCKVILAGKKEESTLERIGRAYRCSIRQIVSLLIRYWAVMLAFLFLYISLGKKQFEWKEFLSNVFCIETTYNGAFWYVEQYVKMLLLLPLFDGALYFLEKSPERKRKRILTLAACLVPAGCAAFFIPLLRAGIGLFLDWIRVAFFLVFLAGYLLAHFRIFEGIFGILSKWGGAQRMLLGAVLLILAVFVRIFLADSAAYAKADFLIVPVFAFGVICLFEKAAILQKLLEKLGSITAYLWLTHLFILELTSNRIYALTESHVIFFFLELAICIPVGYACLMMEKFVLFLKSRTLSKSGV